MLQQSCYFRNNLETIWKFTVHIFVSKLIFSRVIIGLMKRYYHTMIFSRWYFDFDFTNDVLKRQNNCNNICRITMSYSYSYLFVYSVQDHRWPVFTLTWNHSFSIDEKSYRLDYFHDIVNFKGYLMLNEEQWRFHSNHNWQVRRFIHFPTIFVRKSTRPYSLIRVMQFIALYLLPVL